MEESLHGNDALFKPTKELGFFIKFAAKKTFGESSYALKIGELLHLNLSTINMIFEGTCSDKKDYIRILSICLRRIQKRKMQLKGFPSSLSAQRVLDSFMAGDEGTQHLCMKALLELCSMPDRITKPHKKRNQTSSIGNTSSSASMQEVDANHTLFGSNSDFEYGITDT